MLPKSNLRIFFSFGDITYLQKVLNFAFQKGQDEWNTLYIASYHYFFSLGRRNGSRENASSHLSHLDSAETGTERRSTHHQASSYFGAKFLGEKLAKRIRKMAWKRKNRCVRRWSGLPSLSMLHFLATLYLTLKVRS